MALGIDVTSILDPLDLGGTQAAEDTLAASEANAALLRRFSDVAQGNLQPFLDLASRTLPSLEDGASPGGFFGDAEALRPLAESLAAPKIQEETERLNRLLSSQGLTRSGAAVSGAADITEQQTISQLLGLQDLLNRRRQQITGSGAGTGGELAQLGLESGQQLGDIQSQGILGSAQARAAGQQNLVNLGALGADFFAPEG